VRTQVAALALTLLGVALAGQHGSDLVSVVVVPRPFRECAVWFGHALDVQPVDGELVARRVPRDVKREPQVQAPHGLPFDPGPAFTSAGSWHVMNTSGGWLVGLDHGEFLGGLWWLSDGGAAAPVLSRLNVISVFTRGPAQAVVVTDDGSRGGAVIVLTHVDGAWRRDREVALDGRPLAAAEVSRGSFVVLGETRVFWLANDAVVRAVDVPLLTRGMRPFLFSRGADGTLFVGMSLHALAIRTDGSVQWLAEEGCERPHLAPALDRRGRQTPWGKACVCS
jgi:hypothetical protein